MPRAELSLAPRLEHFLSFFAQRHANAPNLPPTTLDLSTRSAASTARVWLHGAPALARRAPLDHRIYLMTLIVVWHARASGRAR